MRRMNSKKALGVGQVFVFIIAAISFALIMIFGYKTITEFMARGETASFYQFKNDLENSVKKIYTEYGSVREVDFHVPGKYTQICFVDLDTDPQGKSNNLCDFDSYACDVWEEAWKNANSEKRGYAFADENVFLQPATSEKVPIKVYKIKIAAWKDAQGEEQEGFLCLSIRKGTFSLRLEGKGDRTELSRVKE